MDPEKLNALGQERELMGENERQQSERLFREHLVPATYSLCQMAVYGENERLRMEAARYVVERNIGRVENGVLTPSDDPYEALMAACVRDVEEADTLNRVNATLQRRQQYLSENPNPTDEEGTA